MKDKKVREFEKAVKEYGSLPMFAFLDLIGYKPFMSVHYIIGRGGIGIDTTSPLEGHKTYTVELDEPQEYYDCDGYDTDWTDGQVYILRFQRDAEDLDIERYEEQVDLLD